MRKKGLPNIGKDKSCKRLITEKGKPKDLLKKNGFTQKQKKIIGAGKPKDLLKNVDITQKQKKIAGRGKSIDLLKNKKQTQKQKKIIGKGKPIDLFKDKRFTKAPKKIIRKGKPRAIIGRSPIVYDQNFKSELKVKIELSSSKALGSIKEAATDLIRKANKKGINVEIFKSLYRQYQITDIKRSIFKKAMNLLQELINRAELPRYTEERELIQLMLDGKYYIKRGDSNFQRAKVGVYGGIIYNIICKLPFNIFSDFSGKRYTGRTHKSKFERMMEHIKASLNPYEDHTRKIEQAIIFALNREFNLYQLWEEYQYLSSKMKKRVLKKITKKLLEKYFDLIIIEVHKNYYTTYARELWYIKNYEHYVNGKLTKGTKDPNGLNMIISSGPRKYISLPMYGIAFMIALGYRPKQIAEIINQNYNLGLNSKIVNTRIREFWQSWENAQEKFLKPVVQALIEQNKYNYFVIKDAFNYSHKGFYKVFKRFFEGLTFNQLKMVMARENFDWDSLIRIAEAYKDDKKIRGIPIFKWKEWFIKGVPLGDIAELVGFKSEEGLRTFLNKDENAINKFGCRGYERIVDNFRRERTAERLLDLEENKDLEWIYVNDFGLKSRDDYRVDYHFERQLAAFFERLFDFELTIEELESRDPKILQKFKN